jgi:diacylglycerol kinase family enzyme
VNGKYFVNILSFGLFTTTSQHTPDPLKRLLGRFAYIIEGGRELFHYRAMPLTIRSDEGEFSAKVATALIFNGCTAGRIPLARNAKPDDGLLDAVFITKRAMPCLLFDILRYVCGGKPASIKLIRSRHLHISSSLTDIATDIDGQQGPEFPLEIDCVPGRLKIRL